MFMASPFWLLRSVLPKENNQLINNVQICVCSDYMAATGQRGWYVGSCPTYLGLVPCVLSGKLLNLSELFLQNGLLWTLWANAWYLAFSKCSVNVNSLLLLSVQSCLSPRGLQEGCFAFRNSTLYLGTQSIWENKRTTNNESLFWWS